MAFHPHVFIDTNVFDKNHYNFESREFVNFTKHFKGKKVTVLLPSPIRKEMDKHIGRNARAGIKQLQKFQSDHPFVKQLDHWIDINQSKRDLKSDLIQKHTDKLNNFLASHNVQELTLSGLDPEIVMEQHFSLKPPFREGKKEWEFSDAFALLALEEHHRTTRKPIHIISSDSDFEKYSEQSGKEHLKYYESIPKFLMHCVSVENDQLKEHIIGEELFNISKKFVKTDEFMHILEKELADKMFVIEEDYEGDVEDVEINDIYTTEVRSILIGESSCEATFTSQIQFSSILHYRDLPNGTYDKEDDVWLGAFLGKSKFQGDLELKGVFRFYYTNSEDHTNPDTGMDSIECLIIENSYIEISASDGTAR